MIFSSSPLIFRQYFGCDRNNFFLIITRLEFVQENVKRTLERGKEKEKVWQKQININLFFCQNIDFLVCQGMLKSFKKYS